jgi:acyl transferase domain-containing protein/3-hydroxymyristoyl/3-hydroxydecanoyl-(acyl carrier protein) dehydratase
MGLALPGALSPEEFWENTRLGKSFFRDATSQDFGADPKGFVTQDDTSDPTLDKAPSIKGAWIPYGSVDKGFLQGLKLPNHFDPEECDESLIYLLHSGSQAVAQTDLSSHDPKDIGVIAGHIILPTRAMSEAAISLYGKEALRDWDFNPFAPSPHTNPFRSTGYSARLLSEALGFTGPAFTLDAACASSLYAIHIAFMKLISGSISACLAGGLAKADPLFTQLGFAQLRALSPSGVSAPFSLAADGLLVGTGASIFVLKRLDRALVDKDRIRALILGVGLSNDRNANPLAPNSTGQLKAMEEAYKRAGTSFPSGDLVGTLGLIEAHGTATKLGDTTELSSIKEFLSQKEGLLAFPPVIGSVKGAIGHLLSAAGAAGLAKAALALENQVLPPSTGSTSISHLDIEKGPNLALLAAPEPWPQAANGARLAMVNAFGFGGVNAQAILEAYEASQWESPQKALPKLIRPPLKCNLISARTVLAPWLNYEALARYWLTPEEPPVARSRRVGSLKATGFFFEDLILDANGLKIPPKELIDALPQQTLALKVASYVLKAAGLNPDAWPQGLDPDRVGIFMGVDTDPRASDYAVRWLAPIRAANKLIDQGRLDPKDLDSFIQELRSGGPGPLTHPKVLGALGSLVASRLARILGIGGPSFTLSEERDSGFRALREAIHFLNDGTLDLALVGVVDTFGDPKTAALAPRTIWVEGAAGMLLANDNGAKILAPLAELHLEGQAMRLGPLSGLFAVNRSGFYLRHHIKPLGRGQGFSYWLKNPEDPPREVAGPGYVLKEFQGSLPRALTVPPEPVRPDIWFFVRGRDKGEIDKNLNELLSLTEEPGPIQTWPTLAARYEERHEDYSIPPAMAILAKNPNELSALIKKAIAGTHRDSDPKPKIFTATTPLIGKLAWVFPGAGNHYKGMGRTLGMAFPDLMSTLESETTKPRQVFQEELFWEPNFKKPTTREALLAQTVFGVLTGRVLNKLEIVPQVTLGYSLGETVSLVATGIWPDKEELYESLMTSKLFDGELTGELTAPRAYYNWPPHKPLRWLCGLFPKSEASIRKAMEKLIPALRHRLHVLLINTPEETLCGGEQEAVQALSQVLGSTFVPIEDLPSVHAPVVSPVEDEYRAFHTRKTVPNPNITLYSSYSALPLEQNPTAIADSLTKQALLGHNFPELINRAYNDGVRFFVELGPGNSTSRMIKSILGTKPHMAQSLGGSPIDEGWAGISRVIADLWLAGYPLVPEKLIPKTMPRKSGPLDVPIKFSPPTFNWPTPEPREKILPSPNAVPKEQQKGRDEDYLSWLKKQTLPDTKPSEKAPTSLKAYSKTGLRTVEIPQNPRLAAKTQGKLGLRTVEIPQNPRLTRRHDYSQSSKPPYAPPSQNPDGLSATLPREPKELTTPKPQLASFPKKNWEPRFSPPEEPKAALLEVRTPRPLKPLENLKPLAPEAPELPQSMAPEAPGGKSQPLAPEGPGGKSLPLAPEGPGGKSLPLAPEGREGKSQPLAPEGPGGETQAKKRGRPKGSVKKKPPEPMQSTILPVLNREDTLEFATGSIAKVFGEEFNAADKFPSRVRLPNEPLMLVDRVLNLEGAPKSLGPGRIVTEHDVLEGGWYLDQGRLTPGLSIESGQADLMLSGYLGADFKTKGLAYYRLLDAEVIFLRDLPLPGEVARYDIGIVKFFNHAESIMFRFAFEGSIGNEPLMSMLNGCAGFFTPAALAMGKGLANPTPKAKLEGEMEPGAMPLADFTYPVRLEEAEINLLRQGDLGVLGKKPGDLQLENPNTLPSGRLSLIDRAALIDRLGGAYNRGFIRAEAKVDPEAWFLTSHFTGDPVMPGTLMYDASLQALRVYLMTMGWLGENDTVCFQPAIGLPTSLKCRGQVTPKTRSVAYEVHIRELSYRHKEEKRAKKPGRPSKPQLIPFCLADAIMWADGKAIAEVIGMTLTLTGASEEYFASLYKQKRRLKDASIAKGKGALSAKDTKISQNAPSPQAQEIAPKVATKSKVFNPNARTFSHDAILNLITGRMSDTLGAPYARFDDGSFVARLPQAPYDFLDSCEIVKGNLAELSIGSEVLATYNVDPLRWVFTESGIHNPLPYAAINEVALQPCGFLALYMGSALPFAEPMHFRNLGGDAVILKEIRAQEAPKRLLTRAKLSKNSVLGAMTIQHYEFQVTTETGDPVYQGITHFGFLSPENLAQQRGLQLPPAQIEALLMPPGLSQENYPRGPSWPKGRWRMLDKILYKKGDTSQIWGRTMVNLGGWFFAAHFPQDPVWPGSLGLEGFIEAAKVLIAQKYYPKVPLEDLEVSFTAPYPKLYHKWLYRGQILPLSRKCVWGLKVTKEVKSNKLISFNGILWIDDLPIYEVSDFTVAINHEGQ